MARSTVMGVSKGVISLLKNAVDCGNAIRMHVGGRERNTPQVDRYVSLVAIRNINLTRS